MNQIYYGDEPDPRRHRSTAPPATVCPHNVDEVLRAQNCYEPTLPDSSDAPGAELETAYTESAPSEVAPSDKPAAKKEASLTGNSLRSHDHKPHRNSRYAVLQAETKDGQRRDKYDGASTRLRRGGRCNHGEVPTLKHQNCDTAFQLCLDPSSRGKEH